MSMRDGGESDPYTKAVNGFLEILSERFPAEDFSPESRRKIELLRDAPYSNFHRSKNSVNELLFSLLLSSRTSEVPQRDLSLLVSFHEDVSRFSEKLDGIAVHCQLAVESAYLDATPEDKSWLVLLSESRDSIFDANDSQLSEEVREFLFLLNELREERKTRGYPDWTNLQIHFDTISTMMKKLTAHEKITVI